MSRTMRSIGGLGWVAIAVCLAFLPACQQNNSGKPKVAFITNNPESFWTIAEAGCDKAAKEFNVEVVFRRPANGAAEQTEIINTLKNQDIKAMAISVINPKGQSAHIDEVAAKMPVITQDNDAPDTKRLCYIGTNNYLAGRSVGQMVKEALPNGGTIAVFVGQLEPLNARQRRQGLLDELADKPVLADINSFESSPDKETYGKYKLHGTFTDQPEGTQKAVENSKDVLTALSDEKDVCMIGLWAYNAPAILTAAKDKGKLGKIKVIGFDEDEATLNAIADGSIVGTVVQDPFGFGYESVKMLASLAKGDKSVLPKDGIFYVPHRVITKEGGKDRIPVEKFRKDLKEMLEKK
jgi:ribose transport system substrate-binding protein